MDISNKSGSPFDKNLILKLVLEHVGRVSVSDLLTCRMVNHSWNGVAVELLEQQHSYALELNYKKLLEFKVLLWNTRMTRMSSEHKTELASLRLSLGIHPLNFLEGGLLSEGAETGQLLMSYPHLRPAFLTLSILSNSTQPRPLGVYSNHELYNLFQLASSSLTSIQISDEILPEDERPPSFEEFDFESYASVEFPKLASIDYNFYPGTFPKNESTHFTKHMVSIIQQATKLTKLHVNSWGANSEKAIGSYRSLLEICATKTELEELDIYEGDKESVLKILPGIKFPKLRTFKLRKHLYITPEKKKKGEEFAQFLEHSCPALTSIILSYCALYPLEMEFPVLPNILHFGLYPQEDELGRLGSPSHGQFIHATFAKELAKKFPSLQSMSINLGVWLMLGAYLKESGHEFPPSEDPEEYPTFPNITSLEVFVNLIFLEEEENDLFVLLLVMASRMYSHTFPALRNLVIKADKSLLWGSAAMAARSLQAIDFLASHSSLQFLEIHNCPTAWINQFRRNKLPGLKTLKIFLPRPAAGADNDSDAAACVPPLKIMKVLSSFPTLEHIQIGNQTVSRAQIQTIRNVISIFENT